MIYRISMERRGHRAPRHGDARPPGRPAWRRPGPARGGKRKGPPASWIRGRGPSGKKRPAARYSPALLGAVPSPRGPLTAVFGTGTGVAAPPWPPVMEKVRQPEAGGRTWIAEGAGAVRRRASARPAPRVVLFFNPPPGAAQGAAAGGGAAKPHGLSEPVC